MNQQYSRYDVLPLLVYCIDMRILQICKKFPYPPNDGETIAILNLSTSFVQLGATVDILTLNTIKHYSDPNKVPAEITNAIRFYSTVINTDISWYKALKAALLFQPYNIFRFYSSEFEQQMIALLQSNQYDIIQLEGLPVLLYLSIIRQLSYAKIAYRAHNIEYEIWQRLAAHEPSFIKSLYYKYLAHLVKKFEESNTVKADLILPITKRDAAFFQQIGFEKPMHIVPACIPVLTLNENNSKVSKKEIFFIGGLDWIPNQEGIRWFIDQCLPILLKVIPELIFHIAGRNMPPEFASLESKNIIIHGEVKDARTFMEQSGIMIVPLLSGGGMRIKIIEAMMLEKAIVSTEIGAEGISYIENKEIIIANKAEVFANAIIDLLQDQEKQRNTGKAARELAIQEYSASSVSTQLIDFYQQQIA